jgi:hypothetical protein
MGKKILIGIIIVLILVQFIQPPHNNGATETTTDVTHIVQTPDTVLGILKVACYDCHSNSTRYPWYSKITPVNWWLNNHINVGKRHLNFSIFTTYSHKKMGKTLDETADQVDKHDMPIGSYLWIHTDARLSDAQRKMLIDWANNGKQQVLQDSLSKLRAASGAKR